MPSLNWQAPEELGSRYPRTIKLIKSFVKDCYKPFEPSGEFIGANPSGQTSYEKSEVVDLKKLKVGSVINLQGSHPHASYLMKIGEGDKVKIWRDYDSEGLVGPLDAVISYYIAMDESEKVVDLEGTVVYGSIKEKPVFERGLIRKGSFFLMPYFEYEPSAGEIPKKVKKPNDAWLDICEDISIRGVN